MRLIAVGDTHGRSFWKLIANTDKWDKFVFIGDYWDSFDISYIEQLHNFREICKFKEENPDKVVLLFGKHDFNYTPTAGIYGDRYSGYQHGKAMEIGYEIQKNKDLFQMAYRHNNYLFTHAGVTTTWYGYAIKFCDMDVTGNVDEVINEVFKYRPHLFCFNGIDGTGDDVTQSPIWVRPRSLVTDAYSNYTQVVGHTGIRYISLKNPPINNDGHLIMIDALGGKNAEYLIIDDDMTSVGICIGTRDSIKYPSTDFDK